MREVMCGWKCKVGVCVCGYVCACVCVSERVSVCACVHVCFTENSQRRSPLRVKDREDYFKWGGIYRVC